MRYLKWIWLNTLGIRANMALRVMLGFVQVILGLALVWLCKEFIDITIRTDTVHDIWINIILLIAVMLGNIALRQCYYYMGVEARTRQTNGIRLRIFSKLMFQRLYEGETLHSGDMVSRLEHDIDQVGDTVTSVIPEALVTCGKLLGAFILLHWMDATLAWVLLLATPLFIAFGKLMARQLKSMTHDIRQQESHIQMTIQESLEHNTILRALESTSLITTQVGEMQHELHGKINRRTRFTIVTRTVIALCFGLGYLFAFIWGGLQLREGAITLGVMTSFLQLVGQIQHPVLNLLNAIPQLIHTAASIDRLTELEQLQTEEQQTATGQAAAGQMIQGVCGVTFDNVSFSYAKGDFPVTAGFTHDFRPGSKTAIMGHTGVGKTTLFRLLLGLAEPTSGTISIYDDTRRLRINTETRRYMVFVPQGNTLMSGTVRYNLLLARPDASDDELRSVLHIAMADFVMDMPDGLDTVLGERSAGLSEGQAQRIAIARGLLRPGKILLLDEISSALDEQTESELFKRLFEAYPDKTVLMITHRQGVANLCDKIVTLG